MGCSDHPDPVSYHAGKFVYISETGLYQLIFFSRLEAANRFRCWVLKEVLPSICKTGGYELQALKNELMLKDKTHQEELNKAKKELTLKDEELAKTKQKCVILSGQLNNTMALVQDYIYIMNNASKGDIQHL